MSVSMMVKKREDEGSSGYMHAFSSVSVDPQEAFKGDLRFFGGNKKVVFQGQITNEEKALDSCSSSSSIGKNSDISEGSMEKTFDSEEVQSSYKGPLSSMEALEEVLPMRKGISRFYNGKSKSFTSLREASTSPSMKELAKPENAYVKRRRNILGCGLGWESNRKRGGISKRVSNSSGTTLALAAAMNCCSSSSGLSGNTTMLSSFSGSSAPFISPLNPEYNHNYCKGSNNSPWRSFSLADLQHCQFVPPTLEAAGITKLEKEPT